jgi:hypothetical protein
MKYLFFFIFLAASLFGQYTPETGGAAANLFWHLESDAYVDVADGRVTAWGSIHDDSTTYLNNAGGDVRPNYVLNYWNGEPAIKFDGSDDSMIGSGGYVTFSESFEYFVVFGNGTGVQIGGNSSTLKYTSISSFSPLTVSHRMSVGAEDFLFSDIIVTPDTVGLLHVYHNKEVGGDSAVSVFINRERSNTRYAWTEGDTWKTATTVISFLGRALNTYSPTTVMAVVVYKDTVLSMAERTQMYNYLNDKYAFSTPVAFHVDSVSGDGTTGNNGDSDQPWQSINGRPSLQYWDYGDSLLLNRGDTFPELFTPTSSGISTDLLFLSAYGTGASPLIQGIDRNGQDYWAVDSSIAIYTGWQFLSNSYYDTEKARADSLAALPSSGSGSRFKKAW